LAGTKSSATGDENSVAESKSSAAESGTSAEEGGIRTEGNTENDQEGIIGKEGPSPGIEGIFSVPASWMHGP
jgi:hypothetical protein